MIRKLLLTFTVLTFVCVSAAAQSFHAELSYQSFRPFINFQVELGSYDSYQRDTYQSAYIKGYMDGVNQTYYSDYRFYELVHDIDAYETGYRDGYRDQALLCDLRGNRRLFYPPFSYNDYYSPYYSVQVWLSELSFTFIKAPSKRLPRYWTRRVHPSVKKYRRHYRHKRYHSRYEKRYKHHRKQLRKRARYNQKQFRNNSPGHRKYSGKRLNKKRVRQRIQNIPKRSHSLRNSQINRSRTVRSRPERTVKQRPRRGEQLRRAEGSKRSIEQRTRRPDRVNRSEGAKKKSIKTGSQSKSPKIMRSPRQRNRIERNRGGKNSKIERKRTTRKRVKNNRSGKRKKVRSRSRSGSKSRGKVKRQRNRKDKSRKIRRGGS